MKYLVHMTVEELACLVDEKVKERIAPLEKSLAYLTEKKDSEFLKIEEVAQRLHVTERTIRNWVKKKKLRCYWIEGRQFFLMKDVVQCMQSNF